MPRVVISAILIVLFSSCSEFGKLVKSKNQTLKFNKAVEYYNQKTKKGYTKALTLLEQLRENYKGQDSMEIVYYYTAMANYGIKDYEFAALYFKDFTENFPNSPKLVECAYMHVNCQFLSIGTYELDQSNTIKTIGSLQSFINNYPNSTYAELCNAHIDVLRRKLMRKQYEIVMQYYDMGDFRAAVVSARNTLKSYPDMEQKEELEFLMAKAQYLFAFNSIDKKRLERMNEALENWKEYQAINGNTGAHHREADALKKKIDQELHKLKQTT